MATLKKRLTIGFLTDQLDEQFHRLLWTGVDDVAKEHDVNLIVYSGKCLRAGLYFEYNENIVFGMVNFDRLDGILLSSGSLGNFISKKNYAAFVEYYRKNPS
jgi:DNA-binding LacI/PurR family transcriptional regulator